jgi:hypothetical protein
MGDGPRPESRTASGLASSTPCHRRRCVACDRCCTSMPPLCHVQTAMNLRHACDAGEANELSYCNLPGPAWSGPHGALARRPSFRVIIIRVRALTGFLLLGRLSSDGRSSHRHGRPYHDVPLRDVHFWCNVVDRRGRPCRTLPEMDLHRGRARHAAGRTSVATSRTILSLGHPPPAPGCASAMARSSTALKAGLVRGAQQPVLLATPTGPIALDESSRNPVDTLGDRGSQYVCIGYSGRWAEAGIEPSVGSTGNRTEH